MAESDNSSILCERSTRGTELLIPDPILPFFLSTVVMTVLFFALPFNVFREMDYPLGQNCSQHLMSYATRWPPTEGNIMWAMGG